MVYLKKVLMLLVFVSLGMNANMLACGVGWNPPLSPFSSETGYLFRYWETIGTLELDSKTQVLINIGFDPTAVYVSPLLGKGWSLALFDSRIEQVDDKSFLMRMPDGHECTLTRTKKPNILEGADWVAEIQGGTITCKASCGWVLVYRNGRLLQMKSPTGILCDFSWETGVRTMRVAGKPMITLKTDWDGATTQKFHRLTFGAKSVLLKMGQRPTLIKSKGKPDRKEEAETLVAIEEAGQPEIRYDFSQDSLSVAGHLYKWNPDTGQIAQDRDWKFSYVTIKGVKCLQYHGKDGKMNLEGRDFKKGIKVYQDSGGLVLVEEFFSSGVAVGKPRRIYQIGEKGAEIPVRQYWYDESGKLRRMLISGTERDILYTMQESLQTAVDPKDNALIWEKKFDAKGRVIELKVPERIYTFRYNEPEQQVEITSKNSQGALLGKATVPVSQISLILDKLNTHT
ncbi:MAG: hypothetical protein LBV12_01585 [Puniceicoccales bacterium]|jgi:hypothetical protein|nr:hypothetical protein [Puniceicoccales bacterium]